MGAYMTNLTELPKELPVPCDDGTADHLLGMKLPQVTLQATTGLQVNVGQIPGVLVLYCYPMTGQPNVPLPDGWDQIPGARGCTPQSCSFRDHYQEIRTLGAEVMGLSVQSTEYQREMAQRPLGHFSLILGALYTQSHHFSTQSTNLLVVIPKRAALRSATPCPWNLIPTIW